jgi:hypothetical protein
MMQWPEKENDQIVGRAGLVNRWRMMERKMIKPSQRLEREWTMDDLTFSLTNCQLPTANQRRDEADLGESQLGRSEGFSEPRQNVVEEKKKE